MKTLCLFALTTFFVLIGCEKNDTKPTIVDISGQIQKGPFVDISGQIQKGPFVDGTIIEMYQLNSSLTPTGEKFIEQTTNDVGAFEFQDVPLQSSFVKFYASGYYYNEVSGQITSTKLDLLALSDVTDASTVNVNILTHLEKPRVEKLMAGSLSLSEAKTQAQQNVLSIFNYQFATPSNSENLDITSDTENNAMLLAISAILQGNRNVGELTELLSDIMTDMSDDGLVSDAIKTKLRASAIALNLSQIRNNLTKRYSERQITTQIPNFEQYVNSFINSTALKPEVSISTVSNLSASSVTLNGVVNANSSNTTVTFEWGETTAYGNSSVVNVSGNVPKNISTNLTNLNEQTIYHYKITAVNSLGTASTDDGTFTTDPRTITDVDGNIYNVARINSILWMTDNLKTTKYNDNTAIQFVDLRSEGNVWNEADKITWNSITTGAYCWYNGNVTNKNVYGALYKYTDDTKLCPTGWRLPTTSEWLTVKDSERFTPVKGGYIMGNSETGPGAANPNSTPFRGLGDNGYWWIKNSEVRQIPAGGLIPDAKAGLSVRCVRN